MTKSPFADAVSVIIPTRNRARMVLLAVESALAQTHAPLEVIVVIDGPEEPAAGSTVEMLAAIGDERLRVVALPESVGGGEARNTGVRASAGDWVAFLDDDDLWLPDKLRVQLDHAARLPEDAMPVVSCRVLARSPRWEEVWPRELYRSDEPLSEYLFCRRGWRYGSALLQTSTLLAPRELLLRAPFARGLKKHQDWDWLLRVGEEPGVTVHSAGEAPLAVFHVEGNRASVGRLQDWRFSLEWATERKRYFTRRAFAGFLATECAAQAQAEGWRAKAALMAAFLRNGVPPAGQAVQFLVFLLLSRTMRRALRDVFRRKRLLRSTRRSAPLPNVF